MHDTETGLSTEANELLLYIENDYDLYQQRRPFLENMRRKMKSGRFKSSLAPKLWTYYVTRGVKKYGKEHLSGEREGMRIFKPKVRLEVATRLARDAEEELRGGRGTLLLEKP